MRCLRSRRKTLGLCVTRKPSYRKGKRATALAFCSLYFDCRLLADERSAINVIYTSLKSTYSAQQFRHRQWGFIFIRLAIVVSQKGEISQNSEKSWTYSSSRSSKVIDLGTNRKRICNILLVIRSNFGRISYRFQDIDAYKLENSSFSLTTFVWRPLSGEPVSISGLNLYHKN